MAIPGIGKNPFSTFDVFEQHNAQSPLADADKATNPELTASSNIEAPNAPAGQPEKRSRVATLWLFLVGKLTPPAVDQTPQDMQRSFPSRYFRGARRYTPAIRSIRDFFYAGGGYRRISFIRPEFKHIPRQEINEMMRDPGKFRAYMAGYLMSGRLDPSQIAALEKRLGLLTQNPSLRNWWPYGSDTSVLRQAHFA